MQPLRSSGHPTTAFTEEEIDQATTLQSIEESVKAFKTIDEKRHILEITGRRILRKFYTRERFNNYISTCEKRLTFSNTWVRVLSGYGSYEQFACHSKIHFERKKYLAPLRVFLGAYQAGGACRVVEVLTWMERMGMDTKKCFQRYIGIYIVSPKSFASDDRQIFTIVSTALEIDLSKVRLPPVIESWLDSNYS
jgi:hypothetical protein